jgi:hypothetical protein
MWAPEMIWAFSPSGFEIQPSTHNQSLYLEGHHWKCYSSDGEKSVWSHIMVKKNKRIRK